MEICHSVALYIFTLVFNFGAASYIISIYRLLNLNSGSTCAIILALHLVSLAYLKRFIDEAKHNLLYLGYVSLIGTAGQSKKQNLLTANTQSPNLKKIKKKNVLLATIPNNNSFDLLLCI